MEGQDIAVVGYCRGWGLLREVNTSAPVTCGDWVIKGPTGAILPARYRDVFETVSNGAEKAGLLGLTSIKIRPYEPVS